MNKIIALGLVMVASIAAYADSPEDADSTEQTIASEHIEGYGVMRAVTTVGGLLGGGLFVWETSLGNTGGMAAGAVFAVGFFLINEYLMEVDGNLTEEESDEDSSGTLVLGLDGLTFSY